MASHEDADAHLDPFAAAPSRDGWPAPAHMAAAGSDRRAHASRERRRHRHRLVPAPSTSHSPRGAHRAPLFVPPPMRSAKRQRPRPGRSAPTRRTFFPSFFDHKDPSTASDDQQTTRPAPREKGSRPTIDPAGERARRYGSGSNSPPRRTRHHRHANGDGEDPGTKAGAVAQTTPIAADVTPTSTQYQPRPVSSIGRAPVS